MVNPNYKEIIMWRQENDPDSILVLLKQLIRNRRDMRSLCMENPDLDPSWRGRFIAIPAEHAGGIAGHLEFDEGDSSLYGSHRALNGWKCLISNYPDRVWKEIIPGP